MKLQIITGLLCLLTMAAIGQESKQDSVEKKEKAVTQPETAAKDSSRSHPNFSIQLTLSRIDLGLAKFTDNGSFTLSAPNQFLETDTWKTHNVGFEFFQMGYRFTHHFKVYLGAGIDWTHMRLKQDVTIKPGSATLDTIERNIDFQKNRFSSTYLRIPLSVQIRTNDDRKGNKIYLVFGPEIGFLINGKVKQVSEQEGKEKVKDDFNLNPFRYGAFGRLGYDDFGIYVKYYNSDVFADDQGPKGFKNLNFGVMVGF
ncbi:outer membrane beta-barrel protein [Paradesertivirga mongoliensis]|uniref:Outer membrane beta-barrel protein n=1 Tax=Paradesertivirga mongoliensis TaxID=2100740 RepID=A0ABW4ZGC0_9SPHI|nr:outer membrane beta-barrel protein [Pedobacter mongoliensis]